jgi:hypothetical protein
MTMTPKVKKILMISLAVLFLLLLSLVIVLTVKLFAIEAPVVVVEKEVPAVVVVEKEVPAVVVVEEKEVPAVVEDLTVEVDGPTTFTITANHVPSEGYVPIKEVNVRIWLEDTKKHWNNDIIEIYDGNNCYFSGSKTEIISNVSINGSEINFNAFNQKTNVYDPMLVLREGESITITIECDYQIQISFEEDCINRWDNPPSVKIIN